MDLKTRLILKLILGFLTEVAFGFGALLTEAYFLNEYSAWWLPVAIIPTLIVISKSWDWWWFRALNRELKRAEAEKGA